MGSTPSGTELPRCVVDEASQDAMRQQSEGNRATLPQGADVKWRYMWRIGQRPAQTQYAELNSPPVVPAGQHRSLSVAGVADCLIWGRTEGGAWVQSCLARVDSGMLSGSVRSTVCRGRQTIMIALPVQQQLAACQQLASCALTHTRASASKMQATLVTHCDPLNWQASRTGQR